MITGFLGYLSTRKQAYVGKSAKAIVYDPVKKRYIIDGEEEESEDEDIMPPPGGKIA